MDCDIAREALSARIDGEREPVLGARVDEHLADCRPCRDWQAEAVEQTQVLRRLAGRSQLAAVRQPAEEVRPPRRPAVLWRRWALGALGVVQLGLAVAQGMGAELGIPHAASAGHVLNESTAWSAALGVVMLAAGLRPVMAGGLAWVLGSFVAFLLFYELTDTEEGRATFDRALTHLPVLAGAVLALLVWRFDRDGGGNRPDRPATVGSTDSAGGAAGESCSGVVVLPENASRGLRRRHLRTADGSAA